MGISFHRGPNGEPGRELIYKGLMDEIGVSLHRGPIGKRGEGVASMRNCEN
jgi:hypothetical protein